MIEHRPRRIRIVFGIHRSKIGWGEGQGGGGGVIFCLQRAEGKTVRLI